MAERAEAAVDASGGYVRFNVMPTETTSRQSDGQSQNRKLNGRPKLGAAGTGLDIGFTDQATAAEKDEVEAG